MLVFVTSRVADPHRRDRRHRGEESRARRAVPDHDAHRRRRRLRRPVGRLPGRGADHRLRRRHRRAVLVRDHVPRRRSPRAHPLRTARRPARLRRRSASSITDRRTHRPDGALALGDRRRRRSRRNCPTRQRQRAPTRHRRLHDVPLRLRGDRGAAHHRRRRRGLAGASRAPGRRARRRA